VIHLRVVSPPEQFTPVWAEIEARIALEGTYPLAGSSYWSSPGSRRSGPFGGVSPAAQPQPHPVSTFTHEPVRVTRRG
jgi:hypothetical protein